MHGNAILRPVWHTFRVDASFDKQRGITGIGLILRATDKAGRDGAVVARFSEAYIGLPIQAGEQFAVLRALEIASERGYRLLRVRSDHNRMRIVLKDDYQAGVVQDEHNLRGMILRLAQKFDQVKVRMDTAPQESGSSLSGSQSGAPKRAGRARRRAEIFGVGQHLLKALAARIFCKWAHRASPA